MWGTTAFKIQPLLGYLFMHSYDLIIETYGLIYLTTVLMEGISPLANTKAPFACLFYQSAPVFAWHELQC